MSELAAQTSLTPSGLTRSVDRLAGSGAGAPSSPAPRTGGAPFAVLTADGQELMDRAIPEHLAQVGRDARASSSRPDEERAFAELLRRVRDHVLEANAGVPDWDRRRR